MTRPLPPSSSSPFSLAGERATALCLHGFTGSPYEMRYVADALAASGIGCEGALLPGHGTVAAALNDVSAEDWIAYARRALDELPAHRPRFVVGCSMGGLLGILLAAERPDVVSALVLYAPALVPRATGSVALALAGRGLARITSSIAKSEKGGDIADDEARAQNPCYAELPVLGMAQFDRVRRMARAALQRVAAPLFVAHGALDGTMHPSSAGLVARRARSRHIERYLLPRSRHVIGIDVEREELARLTVRFLSARAAAARVA